MGKTPLVVWLPLPRGLRRPRHARHRRRDAAAVEASTASPPAGRRPYGASAATLVWDDAGLGGKPGALWSVADGGLGLLACAAGRRARRAAHVEFGRGRSCPLPSWRRSRRRRRPRWRRRTTTTARTAGGVGDEIARSGRRRWSASASPNPRPGAWGHRRRPQDLVHEAGVFGADLRYCLCVKILYESSAWRTRRPACSAEPAKAPLLSRVAAAVASRVIAVAPALRHGPLVPPHPRSTRRPSCGARPADRAALSSADKMDGGTLWGPRPPSEKHCSTRRASR